MAAESCGVLYVATGSRHMEEMSRSLASLRAVHPDLPVALATDLPGRAPREVRVVIDLPDPRRDFIDKVPGMLASPFDRTLFLDTDTFVCGPIEGLFALLDRFDLAVAREGCQDPLAPRACPPAFDEFNTGVVLFRRTPATLDLLADWLERHDALRAGPSPPPNDGRAFRDALWASRASLYVLPSEYNLHVWIPQFVQGGAAVSIMHGRRHDLAESCRQANRWLVPRVVVPGTLFLHEATLAVLGRKGRRAMSVFTALARALEPLLRRRRSPLAIDPFAVPPRDRSPG